MRSHHGTISLAPLDRHQVRDMVASLPPATRCAKEVIEGVTERTGGVPLFVEEVTRLLLERGEQGGIQAIPPTLQQSLTARLDRLGPAREVAQIGCGDRTRLLLRASSRRRRHGRRAAASGAGTARRGRHPAGPGPAAGMRLSLQARAHSGRGLRELAQEPTPGSCTAASAEILRDQFAATAAAEPELLAHHFTQAGLTEAAIEWWGKAGQRSLARSALVEGAEQLKRALDQIATLPATPALRREEIKLQVAFANALALTGDFVDGKEHYDRALAIYDPAEHRPLTTRSGRDVGVALLSFRSGCLWLLGYPAASRNDAERAVKNAREIGHATTLMYALFRAGY